MSIMDNNKSHMPFLNTIDGRLIKMFCVSPSLNIWKIVVGENKKRLGTNSDTSTVECSPVFWQENGFIKGSYVSGDVKQKYHLYAFITTNLHGLLNNLKTQPIEQTKAGCVFPKGRAFVRMKMMNKTEYTYLYVYYVNKKHIYELLDNYIYRVSFNPQNTSELFISGGSKGNVWAISLNLDTDQQQDIKCDGYPAYKMAFFNNKIEYALKIGTEFEDRQIKTAKHIEYKPIQLLQRVM